MSHGRCKGRAAVISLFASLSWGALAPAAEHVVPGDFPTIQAAIAAASEQDQVLVAPGTYRENLDFAGKAISVESMAGRGVTVLLPVRKDQPAVRIVIEEGSTPRPIARLSGFKILGDGGVVGVEGSGDLELLGLEVRGFAGPGILSSGRIINCITSGNHSGVVINCCSRAISTSVVGSLIEDNVNGIAFRWAGTERISGNTVRWSRNYALEAYDTRLDILEGNIFESNQGGVFLQEVISQTTPSPIIRFNTFRRNEAHHGGAIFINTVVELIGNVFEGNTAYEWGGAVSIWRPGASIRDNLFISNNAPFGGALSLEFTNSDGRLEMIGNTFAGNTCSRLGAGVLLTGPITDNAFLLGNIFWGNRSPLGASDLSGVPVDSVFASDVEEPGFAGRNGNISLDPRFVDAAGGDFHLRAGSPCIDQGLYPFPPASPEDIAERFGELDFERDARVLDGDGDGVSAPDMGADEFSRRPGIRVGDCDGSGVVDITDVFVELEWIFGHQPLSCLAAGDVNRDGIVELTDVILLLSALFALDGSPVSMFDVGRCRSEAVEAGVLSCLAPSCP